jgi:hypothetical protein
MEVKLHAHMNSAPLPTSDGRLLSWMDPAQCGRQSKNVQLGTGSPGSSACLATVLTELFQF